MENVWNLLCLELQLLILSIVLDIKLKNGDWAMWVCGCWANVPSPECVYSYKFCWPHENKKSHVRLI